MERRQLICKANRLTGFFMVPVVAKGYFQTDFNKTFFSEGAIEKCPSMIIPAVGSFLVGLQTVTL